MYSTNAPEAGLWWTGRPLGRFRTDACLPLFSGIRYLNSPSTLSAPPAAPAWPARTDARAVFEVLLATAELLGSRENTVGNSSRWTLATTKRWGGNRPGVPRVVPGGGWETTSS